MLVLDTHDVTSTDDVLKVLSSPAPSKLDTESLYFSLSALTMRTAVI